MSDEEADLLEALQEAQEYICDDVSDEAARMVRMLGRAIAAEEARRAREAQRLAAAYGEEKRAHRKAEAELVDLHAREAALLPDALEEAAEHAAGLLEAEWGPIMVRRLRSALAASRARRAERRPCEHPIEKILQLEGTPWYWCPCGALKSLGGWRLPNAEPAP